VRDQASRDEQTLRIVSSMLAFAFLLGIGWGLLALTRAVVELPDGVVAALVAVLLAVAAGLAVAPLTHD